MKRTIAVFMAMIMVISTFGMTVNASAVNEPMCTDIGRFNLVTIDGGMDAQPASLVHVAEFDIEPGQAVSLGRYYLDTVTMSVSYTPASASLSYGVCVNFNPSSTFWHYTATGGSGSGTLYRTAGYYYVTVANPSNSTIHAVVEYTESVTLR